MFSARRFSSFFAPFHQRTSSCLNRLSCLRVSGERAKIKTIFGLVVCMIKLSEAILFFCLNFHSFSFAVSSEKKPTERHGIKLIILL